MTNTETLTHVRIVNGGTPEFITVRAALDEIESGMRDRKNVRTMSAKGSHASMAYRTGETVVIRPATDDDRPQPASAPTVKLTPAMTHRLVQAAGNRDGHYAANIQQGGGTSGALLRRGLIADTGDRGYCLTAAGFAAARSVSAK
jgi:hypothetical protein